MKKETTLEGCLGYLVIALVGIVVSMAMKGFVLVKLWKWFILPTFENMPSLSIPVAIGISMILSYMVGYSSKTETDESKSTGQKLFEAVLTAMLYPVLVLMFGWLVYQFV